MLGREGAIDLPFLISDKLKTFFGDSLANCVEVEGKIRAIMGAGAKP